MGGLESNPLLLPVHNHTYDRPLNGVGATVARAGSSLYGFLLCTEWLEKKWYNTSKNLAIDIKVKRKNW